jgi:molecular chaperone DnaK (HSP70)
LEYLNFKGNKYIKDDIKWVVTIPAIWNEYGKQFMINCSKKAGMNDISIALEPEAASLTMFTDNNINKKFKEKGKIFMLIDAGGYTIDITLNEIVDDYGNLKQISPPSGGAYGSMNINRDLIRLVENVFGIEQINDLRRNKYDLWKMTLDSIERKKKEIKDDGSDSEYFKIDIRFEKQLCNQNTLCYKETYFGEVKYDNNYLYVPKDLMKRIILKNILPIIEHIKVLLEKFKNIDLLVFTGGFSNCKILIEEIKKNFKGIQYKILSRPETSVMNGAVIYGIKPNKIISRRVPYTIGISTYSLQKDGTECRNKVIKNNNEILCEYFDIYKRIGEDINNNDIKEHSYLPVYKDQTGARFELYYSKSKNPIYIDEKDNVLVASFDLEMKETHLPINERIALVKMVFSSCISVSAKNIISGKKVKINANYYNRND